MSIKQSFISLQEYLKDLSSLLDSHVVNLVESFSKESLLSQSEVAAIRKPDQQKTKADCFLDIIINKVKNDSDDCFDKLVAYMKNSKDATLLNLANKMSPNQQDIDNSQYRQPVQTESAPSSPPTLMEYEKCHYQQCPTETQTDKASEELVANSVSTFPKRPVPDEKCLDVRSESHLLNCVIQKAEKENCLIQIRFSTVSCTGLPRAGKTSFCNVLMGKRTRPVPPGNTHTIFIKNPSKHPSHEESKWMEINLENLIEIIDQLGSNKESSSKESEITNVDEKWELLFLLDYNIPSSALNLLQPSLVTFVTYKMLGQDFVIPDSHHFIHTRFSKLVKELLSCGCIKRDTKYCELKIAGDCEECRMRYIAFVGVLFGSISDKFFEGEAAVINESLNIVKDNINCSLIDFPLSIWYVDDNTYLYRVKLTDQKDQNIEKIRSSLDEVVAQNSAYKIPNAWMIFYFKLCRLCMENEKSCILYNDALKLWKEERCSEDELHLALHYFHYVGVLFYFDTVEGMKDYVFTDCLWIFEKLSYLLCDFKDSGHDLNAKNVLKYEGILQSKMIKQIKFEGPGGMKLPTFLNLLKHLKYIAPLNDNEYFIPGILEAYEGKPSALEHSYGSLQSQPMLITFSSGSLHRSIFCFLAAYIMRNLPQKWSKLQYKRQQHTFSDMITFRIDIRRYVCITDKIFFLEVKIYSKTNNDGSGYHYSVYKFIQNALYAVCEELQLPPDECKFGFLCSECKDDTDGSIMDHMMLINKFKDEKDVSACCCKTNECSKLLPDHTIWFLEEPSCLESCIHEQATEESEATGGVMVEQESQSSSITNLHKQASSPRTGCSESNYQPMASSLNL